MIVSHKYKYIYLQPQGVDAHLGYMALYDNGLVDKNDICSGLYLGQIQLYKPQNFEPLTLTQYKQFFDFNQYTNKPLEQIMTLVNASLTLKELMVLNYINKDHLKEYNIFAFIRHPIDRFINIFCESQIRRPIPTSNLSSMFEQSINKKYTHLLWQDQHPYHMFGIDTVSVPLNYNNFSKNLEFMLNTLGVSERVTTKYAFSTNYCVDEPIKKLAQQHHTELTKTYSKDMFLWGWAYDNFKVK